MNAPKRVDLNEADYAALRQTYQRAFLRISAELQNATDFGRSNRIALLKQIQVIMNEYGTDVNAFIANEIPAQYKKGVDQALRQLAVLEKKTPQPIGQPPPGPAFSPYKEEIQAAAAKGDWQMVTALIKQSPNSDPFKAEATEKYGPHLTGDVRPSHQALIEEAARQNNYAEVKRLIDEMPDSDPYKASMQSLFGDKIKAAAEASPPPAEPSKLVSFTAIDKEAIESIVTDTQNALGAAMQGVTKNMSQLLTSAQKATIKERLVQGTISGEARQTIKKQIISDFQSSGIGSLEDAGGKTWQLDTYSEMLVRTNAAAARNGGIANTMLQNDQDLVQISDSGSSHPACADWEGKIVSISGAHADDDGVDGSLDEAESDGLFHPNCQHTYSPYISELSNSTIAYNPDSGDYVDQAAGQ